MFERPQGGNRAIIVHLNLHQGAEGEVLQEFEELAASAGATTVAIIQGTRSAPDAKYFVGSGKAEEIRDLAAALEVDLILVNHALSPAQERNLERLIERRVLDRTGLILDIFAQRARSHEGKLQVELAQLTHLSTRLVRGWTHLERQKGGIGLRGPGETQLETDRRLIGDRIKQLNSRLEKVRQQRQQSRRGRRRAEQPTVALVGYTNAGKSTLFNTLTDDHSYAADQLFATLDPTLRRLPLPGGGHLVVADTVGFIHNLPHDLVESFRSTLIETREADLLLHIIDISDEHYRDKIVQVNSVLAEIGAAEVPQLLVFNKIDRLESWEPSLESAGGERIYLSAVTGVGVDQLLAKLVKRFCHWQQLQISLPPAAAKLRAQFYAEANVLTEHFDESGRALLTLRIDPQRLLQLQQQHPEIWEELTITLLPEVI
ncbi:MAG: GTPase HflX [Gammaproteobacteria bacterium]|nr:GTPase HflX [Gammaproteobacteria bacterium]